MANGVICRDTLAAHVDNEILHTSFFPIFVPRSRLPLDPPPRDPRGGILDPIPFGQGSFGSRGRMSRAIRAEFAEDFDAAGGPVPTLSEFIKSVRINATQQGADQLRAAAASFVQREAPRHYKDYIDSLIRERTRAAEDDGRTLLRARSPLDAVHRAEMKVRARHQLFPPDFVPNRSNQRRSEEPLVPINEIGILFLERLRIRPLGHTVERAPFFELSIEPNETVTLRQKSFSKRATSFESTVEQSEERQLEYSSTFTTELAEEYASTSANTQSIGLSHTGQFQYGKAATGQITASHTGDYGATTSDSRTDTESVRDAQTISRRVATTQKTLHRTVVSIATEDSLERESIRVLENNDTRTKKILMRRLMQVLHLSYERYGARMCWAPCIEEPGRDVRSFVPGPDFFKEEQDAIRQRWANAPPPEELGPGPASRTISTDWTPRLSGGAFGLSEDFAHEVIIPDGYAYDSASVELRDRDRNPNVNLPGGRQPQSGATGIVTVVVHVGLKGGADAGNVSYRVHVIARPGEALQAQWAAAVNAWRQQQADQEIQALLEAKGKELTGVDVGAWPISELMRRAIADFFFDPRLTDCDLVAELEHVFEWENLSYRLSAPWWKPGTQVDGLQSLRTTFLNASWARLYIPIRPGFEERAIVWLLMIGAVPRVPDELEYYLADLRAHVLPQYARAYRPAQRDADEIAGSRDIRLTGLDADDWDAAYERGAGFKVLDRWTVTIPTDGVDFETALARCDAATPLRDAQEEAAAAAARVADAIGGNINNVAATVSLAVEAP